MDKVYLKAPNSVVIGFSLPLHDTIAEQWKLGHLQRVTEDGGPWEGDPFDLGGTPATVPAAEDPNGTEDAEPVRPADGAPVKAWREYAAALGACSEEEAAGMSRGDLIKLCTPPEIDPLVPKE